MLPPDCLAASVTAAAVAISKGKTTDEIVVIAAVFSQMSSVLSTIAAQRELQDAICEKLESAKGSGTGDAPATEASSGGTSTLPSIIGE